MSGLVLQAMASGVLVGGLYALLAMGISLGWAFLETINLAHFAVVFTSAYIAYELVLRGMDPLLTGLLGAPLGAILGVGVHVLCRRLRLDASRSLLFTFGFLVAFEGVAKWIWTADYRRIPLDRNPYAVTVVQLGGVAFPLTQLLAFTCAAVAAVAVWVFLRRTYPGKAVQAAMMDREVAMAFGVDVDRLAIGVSALCGATGGIGGAVVPMLYAVYPNAAEQWIGILFAVVILGGLGNPVGAVLGGMLIGVGEAIAHALGGTAFARLVGIVALLVSLVLRPQGLWPLVPRGE